MEHLAQHIESLIFVAENPITLKEIKTCLDETFDSDFKESEIEESIQLLMTRYEDEQFSFEIVEIAKGYQFLTKGAYFNSISTYLRQIMKKRLSRAALETLSIVAYKQPVTKGEIEKIRGVNCDYAVQKLLEKELVTIAGRSEGPGRPLLYGTSEKFMDYFGLKDLTSLPKLKDFKTPDNEIGEAAPIEENVQHSSEDTQGYPDSNLDKDLLDVVETAIAISELIDPDIKSKERKTKPDFPPNEPPSGDGGEENEFDEVVDTAIAVSQVLDPQEAQLEEIAESPTETNEEGTITEGTAPQNNEQITDDASTDDQEGITVQNYAVLGGGPSQTVDVTTQDTTVEIEEPQVNSVDENIEDTIDTAIAVSTTLDATALEAEKNSASALEAVSNNEVTENVVEEQAIVPEIEEGNNVNDIVDTATAISDVLDASPSAENLLTPNAVNTTDENRTDTSNQGDENQPTLTIPVDKVGEKTIERAAEAEKEKKPKRTTKKVLEQIGLKVDIEIITEEGQEFTRLVDEEVAKVESSDDEAVSDDTAINEEAQAERIIKIGDETLNPDENPFENLQHDESNLSEE